MRTFKTFVLLTAFVAADGVCAAPQKNAIAVNTQSIQSNAVTSSAMRTVLVARRTKEQDDEQIRRCAFLGRCGSFTLIESEGTAAYKLGHNEYIADLRSAGEDDNWWLYRPVGNGDPATTMWAFSRRPRCGRYRVLRFAYGAWRFYEQTDAWGIGLGDSTASVAASAGPSSQEILDKLRDIEGKLNAIQPGTRPSLKEIEDQIKARP